MTPFKIAAFCSVFLLETTAFLLNEPFNTYQPDCLPSACKGCIKRKSSIVYYWIYKYYIDCPNVGLTSFPIVKAIDLYMNSTGVEINYSGNHLTAVPANAFRNINPRGYTFRASIYLNNNSISRIDLNAFNSIADSVIYLAIYDNNLDHLPGALSKLSSLSVLYIQNNPIKHIDGAVTSAIGSHLGSLKIDLGHLSSWPEELNSLHSVSHLDLYNLTLELKDINIFHGMHFLMSLVLDYKVKDNGPNFLTIPPAVTRLSLFNYLQIKAEVYCTCSLSYLAHWKLPLVILNTCHGSSGEKVLDYIANIENHCHV